MRFRASLASCQAPQALRFELRKPGQDCPARFPVELSLAMVMRSATLQGYKQQMLRVLVHIQDHLDEPLPLHELAALAALSPYHFHHVFTGMVGESVARHVRRLRLERAATRLKLTRLPVIEIALEAGYETHEAFTRAFHAAFGISPRGFRQRHRPSTFVDAPSGVHFRPNRRPRTFQAAREDRRSAGVSVVVKTLKPMRVAFVRHIGPYDQVAPAWDRVSTMLGKDGLLGGESQFIGICHDDPAVTDPACLRYDACVTVDRQFAPIEDIGVQAIAGGDYAVLTHIGPYSGLDKSYARLFGHWLPRSGRRLRPAPSFEVYLNSPENTDPQDLVVDLHAPLEPR
jgi:AraC family transcriptional regulator